jgi:hypothetical protein
MDTSVVTMIRNQTTGSLCGNAKIQTTSRQTHVAWTASRREVAVRATVLPPDPSREVIVLPPGNHR